MGRWIATRHAERLEQLAILNAPHPLIWREAMQSNTEQRRRSRYVQFFRLPWLPELLLRQGRFRALVQSITERARPGTVKPEELERYRAAWSAPGALTAMLNWYRAFLRKDLPASTNCPIASRVLLGRARLLLRARPCRGELAALRQRQSRVRQERHSLGTAR